jgi:hypothetical protein
MTYVCSFFGIPISLSLILPDFKILIQFISDIKENVCDAKKIEIIFLKNLFNFIKKERKNFAYNKEIQLDPDFGNSLVLQKSVARIEFCQNSTIREKLLRTQKLFL